jgi:hypothetical protein
MQVQLLFSEARTIWSKPNFLVWVIMFADIVSADNELEIWIRQRRYEIQRRESLTDEDGNTDLITFRRRIHFAIAFNSIRIRIFLNLGLLILEYCFTLFCTVLKLKTARVILYVFYLSLSSEMWVNFLSRLRWSRCSVLVIGPKVSRFEPGRGRN